MGDIIYQYYRRLCSDECCVRTGYRPSSRICLVMSLKTLYSATDGCAWHDALECCKELTLYCLRLWLRCRCLWEITCTRGAFKNHYTLMKDLTALLNDQAAHRAQRWHIDCKQAHLLVNEVFQDDAVQECGLFRAWWNVLPYSLKHAISHHMIGNLAGLRSTAFLHTDASLQDCLKTSRWQHPQKFGFDFQADMSTELECLQEDLLAGAFTGLVGWAAFRVGAEGL